MSRPVAAVNARQPKKRRRHPNHRRVKVHRNYTVEDISRLFGSHPNTVRDWIKHRGLPTIDQRRPLLVHGLDLADFLQKRRAKNKQQCQPGQMFCLRCRKPQKPAGDMADYQPITAIRGNLVGICPSCEAMIYRAVSLGKLDQVRGNLQVTQPQALRHIKRKGNRQCHGNIEARVGRGGPDDVGLA